MRAAARPTHRRVASWSGALSLAFALALSGCGPSLIAAVDLNIQRTPKTPRDASVTIDEEYIGPLAYVAAHGVRLPVGEHRVSVTKPGFFPWDQVVVADRTAIVLDVRLEPIPD